MCKKCDDSGWVCEKHPSKPFEHHFWRLGMSWQCGGAGMPCTCNKYTPPWNYPDKTRTLVD